MIQRASAALPDLYEQDETAWLEAMSDLIRQRRYDDLDYPNLGEFLADMAKRDRREVKSRQVILLAHLLKWAHQPERRSGSWRATIIHQRNELEELAGTGVLRNHAEASLAGAYQKAVEESAAETGLPVGTFPVDCPYSLDQLLTIDVTE